MGSMARFVHLGMFDFDKTSEKGRGLVNPSKDVRRSWSKISRQSGRMVGGEAQIGFRNRI
jgi:hypothetical protein